MTAPVVQAFHHAGTGTWSYVVHDPGSRAAAVIDPVLDFDAKSGRTGTDAARALVEHARAHDLDVRWLLERHLFAAGEAQPARFVPDSERRLIQYLGPLRAPEQIAMRGLDGSTVFDFREGRAWRADPDAHELAEPAAEAALLELIYTWEDLQREAAAEATDTRGRPVQGG